MDNFKVFRDKKWLLIFRHKYVSDSDLFLNESEALSSKKENKFSLLGSIDRTFRFHGKYEFLLEYPGNEGFNQWTQTKNPVFAQKNKENGYQPISISWSEESWHGLSRSSYEKGALIDGSPFNETWFYAIGVYEKWSGKFPCFKDGYPCSEVLLWIRISYGECSCSMKQKQSFIFSFCLFICFSFYSKSHHFV